LEARSITIERVVTVGSDTAAIFSFCVYQEALSVQAVDRGREVYGLKTALRVSSKNDRAETNRNKQHSSF
jgi:hypothetical protein